MLQKLTTTPKNLVLLLLRRRRSTAQTHLSGSQTPAWILNNQIYQNHHRLHSLESCESLYQLKPLLAYTVVSGLFHNPFVVSRFLHSCTTIATPNLSFATLLFTHMDQPNLFSWNTMIRAFATSRHHSTSTAFSMYVEMLQRTTLPDKYTFPFLLKACRSNADLNLGRLVHAHAFILGLDLDPFVQTALVNMYLTCGSLDDARCLFDEMPDRDVVAWTGVISGLAGQGCYEQALRVFSDMRTDASDVNPNVATMVSAISACASLGCLNYAKSMHAYLEKVGLNVDVFVGNSLIDAYAKCGSIVCAAKMFDGMSKRDLHSWTAMIMALATHGHGKEALDVFSRMKRIGFVPDSITFVAVLSSCSHAGLVDDGIRIFESMERVYKVVPEHKHYGCMVDLFSRAGLLFSAYQFVMSMPLEPNLAILGALLSACRVHNNLGLGKLVLKKIESVCEYIGGAHVLLSNMYANENQWHEVITIRDVTEGAKSKSPGRSWIEVRGVVHEFVVEDRSHLLDREVYLVLVGLGKLMEGLI